MSVIEEVLLEEYGRSLRISEAIEKDLAGLPKGSIQRKVIGGREYHYLQYREGDKVRSEYVPAERLQALREQIARRKEDTVALKEQEKSRKQIERALGKDLIREYTTA